MIPKHWRTPLLTLSIGGINLFAAACATETWQLWVNLPLAGCSVAWAIEDVMMRWHIAHLILTNDQVVASARAEIEASATAWAQEAIVDYLERARQDGGMPDGLTIYLETPQTRH